MKAEEKSIGEANYEQFADRYAAMVDSKPHNAEYNFPAVIGLLPDVNGLNVLDAGCGPGSFSEWLLERGASVTGFDVTPRMVELAAERVASNADLFVHDLNDPLTFAGDSSFDLVICPLVLDYIKAWEPVFREFARVLKPGGTFVYSVGHPVNDVLWLKYRLKREINYFRIEAHAVEWSGFGEPKPQIRFYRRPFSEMLNPLIKTGFRIDHILEPLPTEGFKQKNPQKYANLMVEPGFICVRAICTK
ncbi:MAG: class I SAM-dependent methyltransferase [Chloroflexota bacterium]